jgi:hypothetical protein
MKRIFCLAVGLLVLSLASVLGQPKVTPPAPISSPVLPPPSGSFHERLQAIVERANPENQPPALTKFNLDFRGGTPAELVKAIDNAMGKWLNVIIPDEDANVRLPALMLDKITFSQLSDALRQGSDRQVYVPGWGPGQWETSYGFKTSDNQPTDNSIWLFYVQNPPPAQTERQSVGFYSLAPYLDRGFTVDDITTAIQTGWKMAGINPPPELNYHKETKLLIAYGEQDKLQTIRQVLDTLPQTTTTRNDIDYMNYQIGQLKKRVDELEKKVSATNSIASEKSSGK